MKIENEVADFRSQVPTDLDKLAVQSRLCPCNLKFKPVRDPWQLPAFAEETN